MLTRDDIVKMLEQAKAQRDQASAVANQAVGMIIACEAILNPPKEEPSDPPEPDPQP